MMMTTMTTMRSFLALALVSLLSATAAATVPGRSEVLESAASSKIPKPHPMILHSAYTPFTPSLDLNTSAVPILAKHAASLGVNTVFVCGSMSQFDTMTMDERQQLLSAWIKAGHDNGLYIIVNVGTTVVREAKALATYAKEQGADAIASMAPYYGRCGTVDMLLEWIMDVASVVPDLPFFFYHIPGTTQTDFTMSDLLRLAEQANFDQLTIGGGVKYVSSDVNDFLNISAWVNENTTRNATILWAPEPKLQAFSLQTPYAGAVLAEDFYGPTYLRMRKEYENGNIEAAIKEQNWKFQVDAIFSKYGGTAAKRASYQRACGVVMGDGRSPEAPFDHANYSQLIAELQAMNFFSQSPP